MRVEIAWAAGPEPMDDVITSIYGDASAPCPAMTRHDAAAFHHLCRIAAGLDSPLIGEKEVLVQFRNAVSVALDDSAQSGDLRKILESVVGVARAIRRRLADEPTGSLATIAAGVASSFDRVAILGAGAMARAAAEHLHERQVSAFSRRPSQVAGVETRGWEEVLDAFATYPVVISTVPGGTSLLPHDVVSRALARRGEPLLLIDLGMPPAWGSVVAEGGVRYLGVDEVAASVDARPSSEVEKHLADGACAAWSRLEASDRVGTVIAAMVGHAERAVSEEVERFARRLSAADDPEPVLRQLAHTVARRVLHPPISYVGSAGGDTDAVEVLAEVFGVEDA